MFFENIRFQIAALAFFVIMLVAYLTNRKLKTRSMAVFSLMLTITGINLISDMITVYTVANVDTIPAWVNRLAHQFFIGSLDALLYLIFVYVLTLSKRRRLHPATWIAVSLPFIISMYFVLFGSISYYNDGNTIYSYGPMPSTIYACVGFYLFASNAVVIIKRKLFDARMRWSIITGIIIWVVAAMVQIIMPGMLITGLAVSLMMVYLFISFENPKEYYEKDVRCFNRNALDTVLDERFGRKRSFYLVNITIDDFYEVCYKMGTREGREVLRQVAMYCSNAFSTDVYHNRNNTLNMIFYDSKDKIREYTGILNNRLKHTFPSFTGFTYLKCRVDILECPKYAKNTNEVHEILDYLLIHPNDHVQGASSIIGDAYMEEKRRYNKIEEILENAIDNDGIYVVYQPIYSNESKSFISAEALVRLEDEKTIGYISPDEFITIAEHKGIIEKLDEMVLEKVCKVFSQRNLRQLGIHYVEVNLSGMQVCNSDLSGRIKSILDRYQISPECLNFEITETATIDSATELKANMGKLHEMGCSFSMDDFGTGYSNLAQIADTKYDLIKIDKSLIWPCFSDKEGNARIVLESVVKMALRIESQIVAEGVETKEQLEYLKSLGIQYIQGFYFSRPLRENEFVEFIQKNQPR